MELFTDVLEEFDFPNALCKPKPLELCEKGDFDTLFKLYYEKFSVAFLYHPSDYLTRLELREDFI